MVPTRDRPVVGRDPAGRQGGLERGLGHRRRRRLLRLPGDARHRQLGLRRKQQADR